MPDNRLTDASDARLKLYRANFHLDTLEKEVRKFLAGGTYQITREDRTVGRHVFKLRIGVTPHRGWGTLAGDFAHNLRSALDHLIWQQALSVTSTPDRRIEYPIFDSYRERDIERRLQYVHDQEMRAKILSLQPYAFDEPRRTLLWLLHSLDIVDKHRRLSVTTLNLELGLKIGDEIAGFGPLGGRIEDGMEIPGIMDAGLVNAGAEMLARPVLGIRLDEPDYTAEAVIFPDSDLAQVLSLVENEIFPIFGA